MGVRETGVLYIYEDPDDVDDDDDESMYDGGGIYVREGETWVKEILEENIGSRLNEVRKTNIWKKVRDRHLRSLAEAQPPENKVCLLNGWLDMETRELEPHSPEYFFKSNVNAECSQNGKPDPDAEALWVHRLRNGTHLPSERKKIEEIGGYIMESWHHAMEMNLVIMGPPQSGKITIEEAIKNLFGKPPSEVYMSPQKVADGKFDAARLRDAMLNKVNDIDSTTIEDVRRFKRILSG